MGYASTALSTTVRTFSNELFAAVHKDHTALNRLITSRLPLCLPPHSENALSYVQGLTVFGLIFEVFENQLAQEQQGHATQGRISGALGLLDITGLHRTERLERDIMEIQIRLRVRHLAPDDSVKCQARDLLEDTEDRFIGQPHLILAHAWAMYLALFNGGRWIRKQLRDAGEGFWMGPPPLSFWEFEGDQDGDDVHAQFRENFELAAEQLTSEEWMDVVQEAREVFALCSRLVEVLDRVSVKEVRRSSAQTARKSAGFHAWLWSVSGYTGLVCLLILVWSFLLPEEIASKR